jgi:hypothetical protein
MKEQDFEPLRLLVNNAPLDDFCGFSPTEMHRLIYEPYSETSPIRVRTDISDKTMDAVPFFKLTEEFLKILQRKSQITLTATGALPREILHELYGHRFITEDVIEAGYVKLRKEEESVVLRSMHINTGLTGLIRRVKRKLSLTRRGNEFLRVENRRELFRKILETYTEKFNWAYNDRYTEYPAGQTGWAFCVYLLCRFGDTSRSAHFYAEKYLLAFPVATRYFIEFAGDSPEKWFEHCFCTRTLERFFEWFGFVNVEGRRSFREIAELKRSTTFMEVFSCE